MRHLIITPRVTQVTGSLTLELDDWLTLLNWVKMNDLQCTCILIARELQRATNLNLDLSRVIQDVVWLLSAQVEIEVSMLSKQSKIHSTH